MAKAAHTTITSTSPASHNSSSLSPPPISSHAPTSISTSISSPISSANITWLPQELIRKICKKTLLLQDVFSLSSSCSMIRNAMWHDERLWQYLFNKKWIGFPLPKKKDVTSWHQLYINTRSWDVGCIATTKIITHHARGVTSLCLDENYLYSGSHDTTIKIYSTEKSEVVATLEGHKYTIWALTSDGTYLYSGSNDHTIRVWDLNTHVCKYVLQEHDSKIFGLEIKDNLLFSVGDKIVKVWDRNTHKPLHTLEGHGGGVNSISVVENMLLSGASDKTFKVWDINTLECLKTVSNEGKILSLAATDNLIFTGHDGCMIKVWDARSYTKVATGTAHNWEVWQLALAGGYLFSGSFDHKINAWDIRASFNNVGTFTGHRGFIHVLTADPNRLFSGSADKSIRVWSSTKLNTQN